MKLDDTFLICRHALNERNRKIFQQYKVEVEDMDLGKEFEKMEKNQLYIPLAKIADGVNEKTILILQ